MGGAASVASNRMFASILIDVFMRSIYWLPTAVGWCLRVGWAEERVIVWTEIC